MRIFKLPRRRFSLGHARVHALVSSPSAMTPWLFARTAPPNWMHALTVVFQLSGMGSFALALHRLRGDAHVATERALDERLHAALDRIGDYWRSGNNLNEISARLEEYSLALDARARRRPRLWGAPAAGDWADEWAARLARRDAAAREAEAQRARAENLLLHVKRCWERNPARRSDPDMVETLHSSPLNAAVVLRVTALTERMDRALCRARPGCSWPRDRPAIYDVRDEIYAPSKQAGD